MLRVTYLAWMGGHVTAKGASQMLALGYLANASDCDFQRRMFIGRMRAIFRKGY